MLHFLDESCTTVSGIFLPAADAHFASFDAQTMTIT